MRTRASLDRQKHEFKSETPETTILIKFAFWRGVGGGGKFTEKLSKTLLFLGNSMTINLEILRILLSEILLSFARLLLKIENARSETRVFKTQHDVLKSPSAF